MKHFKKQAAVLLVALLVLLLAPTVLGAEQTPVVKAGTASASPGSYAYIYVDACDLPELASMDLEVHYDSRAMTLESVSNGGFLSGSMVSVNSDSEGLVKLSAIWAAPVSGNGNLLSLAFRVKEECADGNYPIGVAVGECYNAALEPVAISGSSGSVTVNRPKPAPEPVQTFQTGMSFPNGYYFQEGDAFRSA